MLLLESEKIKSLLLTDRKIDAAEIEPLLFPFGFEDWRTAYKSLCRLMATVRAQTALADILPAILSAIADSANPDRALLNLERFADSVPDKAALFSFLQDNPRTIEMLVILFAGSQFLTDILLRNPDHFEQIKEHKRLTHVKNRLQLTTEGRDAAMAFATPEQKLEALRRFQRWEFLRIGTGDLFGSIDLQAVTSQLSNLARAIIQISLDIAATELEIPTEGFTVLALGKLGGRELNYSSDIDLIFLCRSQSAQTQKLGRHLIAALAQATPEGFLYRVDMRLRPWGGVGTLVPTISEHVSYIENKAQLWEKQALYKARVVAGDGVLGIDFLQQIRPHILNLPKAELSEEIRGMKKKIEDRLKRRGKSWGEVKSGSGSIRDIEFVTQFLQLVNGVTFPEVHSRNTVDGLARLTACKILSAHDYRVAADGYVFLRSVEHHLQIMHNRQTHQLPNEPRELAYLARRLGFQGQGVGSQFVQRYEQHSAALRYLYERHLGADQKQTTLNLEPQQSIAASASEITKHVSRMDKAYAVTFTRKEIELHAMLAGSLSIEKPVAFEARKINETDWQVTIVGYDYLGELALICGLFCDYKLNILQGAVFTYGPKEEQQAKVNNSRSFRSSKRRPKQNPTENGKRKIVDVFRVQPVGRKVSAETWLQYSEELTKFLTDLSKKKQNEVQGEIARRVALKVHEAKKATETLLPVEIAIDNTLSRQYTVLRIDGADTMGFLYELTNALSLNSIHLVRVMVTSIRSRVHDTLFLTDVHGNKIIDPERLYKLRVATVLVKHFTHILPQSPNPQSAMLHFREFVSHLFKQQDWSNAIASLERPDVLDALAKLLGGSDFLWNDFLRMQHENLFPVVENLQALGHAKSKKMLQVELDAFLLKEKNFSDKKKRLNAFKDREMFRIDMRYIQGALPDFKQFSRELSELAESVVESAIHLAFENLVSQFGKPTLEDNTDCPWTMCALGKFGGQGLGFASDIELMFIYKGAGTTTGKTEMPNSLFFEKLVHLICNTIISKHEGIFEVDLRLRPYGKAGSFAVSQNSFQKYYAAGGPAWDYERQALVRLRPIAGNAHFSARVVVLRDTCVYTGMTPDVQTMRAMRERQLRQLVAGGAVNAKFSPGALVDLEYLVQHLQIKYGCDNPDLRLTNTNDAINALSLAGIIGESDFKQLQEAHNFIRKLIEALRMVRGNAKDLNVPPEDSKEFSFLARRLGYGKTPSELKEDLIQHTSQVLIISERLLG